MKNQQISQDFKDAKDTLEMEGEIKNLENEDQFKVMDLIVRVAEMIQRERLDSQTKQDESLKGQMGDSK